MNTSRIVAERPLQFAEFSDQSDAEIDIAATVAAILDGSFSFEDADLDALRDALRDHFARGREVAQTTDDLAALEALHAAHEAVVGKITERDEARAAVENRIAELAADIEGDGDADGEDAPDGEGDGEDAADEAGEDAADEAGETAEQVERTTASVTPAAAASLARFGSTRRTQSAARRRAAAADGDRLPLVPNQVMLSRAADILEKGVTRRTIGEALAQLAQTMRSPMPSNDRRPLMRIPIATGENARLIDGDTALAHHDGDTISMMDEAVKHFTKLRDEAAKAKRLTASGGLCVAPTTDYGLTVVGGYDSPVFLNSLPGFTSSRPVQFFPWLELDLFDAATRESVFGGVDPFGATNFVTAAEDAAGYVSQGGETPDKACVHIQCIDPTVCTLEAVYWCFTIGNFLGRSWPEFVSVFEDVVLKGLSFKRDARAQAKVLSVAKVVQAEAMFGAGVDIDTTIARLVATIRGRSGDDNLPIEVYVPAWAKDVAAEDNYRRLFNSDTLAQLRNQAIESWAQRKVYIHTYKAPFGTTTGGSPTYLDKQDAGLINDWPEEMRIVAFPTGTVLHQSGWNINLGLQETLINTNDYGVFGEIAENVCIRGSQIYAVDIPLCTGGVRGGSVVVDCGYGAATPGGDGGEGEGDDNNEGQD